MAEGATIEKNGRGVLENLYGYEGGNQVIRSDKQYDYQWQGRSS